MKIIRKGRDGVANPTGATAESPWKVLVVDDDQDIHLLTRLNLANFTYNGRGLQFYKALSGEEGRRILREEPDIVVALVDVVMETEDAGLRLVEWIRQDLGNHKIRIIIRTGQPGAAPERLVIDRYDIDDYKEKTDLTAQKLYTTMRGALKSYRDLETIARNREGVAQILAGAPALYRVQPVAELVRATANQIADLRTLVAKRQQDPLPASLVAFAGESGDYPGELCAGSGRWQGDSVERREFLQVIAGYLRQGGESVVPAMAMLFPIPPEERPVGFIYLEELVGCHGADLAQMVRLLAQQCGAALINLHLYRELEAAKQSAVFMLAVASEFKDRETGNHINRIVHFTRLIALALGQSEAEAEEVARAAMLHDLGKLGIPDHILQKPGPLTEAEYAIIKEHPLIGVRILGEARWHGLAASIARSHHEKWDGGGYPDGLTGEAIPLVARIVAVADVYDALTSERPYKHAWSPEEAMAEIERQTGGQFDPQVVAVFRELHQSGTLERVRRNFPT